MVAPYISDEVKPRPVPSVPEILDVFDRPAADALPARSQKFGTSSSSELTEELDGAAEWLGVRVEEILLAALGRTFGRTRGEGAVDVDVTGGHRWASRPVSMICAAGQPMGPTEMLQGAHSVLAGAPFRAGAQSEVLLNVANGVVDRPCTRPLELRVQRVDGLLQIDWWYDESRLDAYSVEEMAEQFPLAAIEITSDAAAPL
ncbi:hypothetical protein [Mycolicibacterium vanbaalenii]|uniref:Uncharacterized protein n=1 Tax=Mycolicibacterium vanbaalenii (strain DSM 7251 / JCM 13017 / BCRC 16820 / KCTC 9966 / NRRL B-24157 / PYR-1) TaxID=350058 RepID=A1T8S5_MYCVP|nr:hypothetical protein [Mycolicibacterium vanbaalenii]ABM13575.1 conserved hypothetical protein [Mycolicibacterium vanbaalenii PYR-1]MCV7130263.1 hypothetical protein [Mycolicibacterium vanbaalenii PYR-1]